MNEADCTIARDLVSQLPGVGYAIGDAAYDSNRLCGRKLCSWVCI